MNAQIEKVMDRQKVANAISEILDAGIILLQKEKMTQDDHAKVKVMRTMLLLLLQNGMLMRK